MNGKNKLRAAAMYGILGTLLGCGGGNGVDLDASTDARTDGSAGDGRSGDAARDAVVFDGPPCALDPDCSDGVYCNGVERCMPGAPGANARGCVAAQNPPCDPDSGLRCDETTRTCMSADCTDPDHDHDGVPSVLCHGADCDDNDANRYPGNSEICDAVGHDEDCDPCTVAPTPRVGTSTSSDSDGDGYIRTTCANTFDGAAPRCDLSGTRIMGNRVTGSDCDDGDPNVHPNETEACNGIDDNCNGMTDEGASLQSYYPDQDRDTYGDARATAVMGCNIPAGYAANNLDCNDQNAAIKPGADDGCNNVDDNCNGTTDETPPGGWGACNTTYPANSLCYAGTNHCSGGQLTCTPNTAPGSVAEQCTVTDEDCDGNSYNGFTPPGSSQSCSCNPLSFVTGTQYATSDCGWGPCQYNTFLPQSYDIAGSSAAFNHPLGTASGSSWDSGLIGSSTVTILSGGLWAGPPNTWHAIAHVHLKMNAIANANVYLDVFLNGGSTSVGYGSRLLTDSTPVSVSADFQVSAPCDGITVRVRANNNSNPLYFQTEVIIDSVTVQYGS